jgi:hypothetical protein
MLIDRKTTTHQNIMPSSIYSIALGLNLSLALYGDFMQLAVSNKR